MFVEKFGHKVTDGRNRSKTLIERRAGINIKIGGGGSIGSDTANDLQHQTRQVEELGIWTKVFWQPRRNEEHEEEEAAEKEKRLSDIDVFFLPFVFFVVKSFCPRMFVQPLR